MNFSSLSMLNDSVSEMNKNMNLEVEHTNVASCYCVVNSVFRQFALEVTDCWDTDVIITYISQNAPPPDV